MDLTAPNPQERVDQLHRSWSLKEKVMAVLMDHDMGEASMCEEAANEKADILLNLFRTKKI